MRTFEVAQSLDEESKNRALKELKLGYLNLADECFPQAEINFKYVLGIDEKCADAWWGMMLCKFGISKEEQLYSDPVAYKSVLLLPECEKALSFASEGKKHFYDDLLERIKKINEGDNY